jgi:hypothetical protein
MRADDHEIGTDARKACALGIASDRIEMRAKFCRPHENRREDREQKEADDRIGQGAEGAIGERLKLDWHRAGEIGEARRQQTLQDQAGTEGRYEGTDL